MGCYIKPTLEYYEGDQIEISDQEVPRRPDATYEWDGEQWALKPASVPEAVTPLQARRALLAAGLLDQVEAAAKAAPAEVRIAWEFASTVQRASPFVAALAGALGLSDAQVDDLFRQAAQLV